MSETALVVNSYGSGCELKELCFKRACPCKTPGNACLISDHQMSEPPISCYWYLNKMLLLNMYHWKKCCYSTCIIDLVLNSWKYDVNFLMELNKSYLLFGIGIRNFFPHFESLEKKFEPYMKKLLLPVPYKKILWS